MPFSAESLVDGWATQISETGAVPEAYVDDRTMYSNNPEALCRAWEVSQQWDMKVGWHLNKEKTQAASIPSQNRPLLSYDDSQEVPCTRVVKTLGHEVPFHYQASAGLQKKRTARAVRTCQRIELLRLNPIVASKLMGMVVTKQFVFGTLCTLIPQVQIEGLRSSMRRAIGLHQRLRCWRITSSVNQLTRSV